MRKRFVSNLGFGLGCFLAILALLVLIGLSWLVICGLVYLFMISFGWTFSWLIGTGVWLILITLSAILAPSKN